MNSYCFVHERDNCFCDKEISKEITYLCGKKQVVTQPFYCWEVEGLDPFFMCFFHPPKDCFDPHGCDIFKEWYYKSSD